MPEATEQAIERMKEPIVLPQSPLRDWAPIIRKLHRIGCAEHACRLEESLLSLQKQRGRLLRGESPPMHFPRE